MNKSCASSRRQTVERPPSAAGVLDLPGGSDFNPPPRRTEPAAVLRFAEEMAACFQYTAFDRATRHDRPATEFDLENPDVGPDRYPAELLDELLRRD